MRIFFVILVAFMVSLSGCATVTANRITTADTQGKLYVGMDFNDVVTIVGRQPNSFSDVYKETVNGDGVYKVWIVNGRCDAVGSLPSYRFYEFNFENDKLTEWKYSQ